MRFRGSSLRGFVLVVPWHLCSVHAQVTVVDDLQREVHLAVAARRIVSLAPSVTECLFAIGAEDDVVGVTDYCNYPSEARQKSRVGGIVNPNIEAIVSLHPDLIILSMEGNVREDFRRLTSLGSPVFVTNPRSIEGIYRSILQLGELTGRRDSATNVVSAMRTREGVIRAKTEGKKPVRTLLIVSVQPLMCAGSKTFLNELIQTAGGANLAARARGTYPTYSREAVVADSPDVIIVMSDAGFDIAGLTQIFPEWSAINAVRRHSVFRIDSDLVSRPGPRVTDALETLFSLLHSTSQ